MKSLRAYHCSDEIKNEAERIYMEAVASGTKKKFNEMAIFFCLFHAHQIMNDPVDPNSLAATLQLNKSKINKALKYYGIENLPYGDKSTGNMKIKSGRHCDNTGYVEPRDIIPYYCDKLNIAPEVTHEIIGFYNIIVGKSRSISEKSPRPVIAGLIMYYIKTNGISLDMEKFYLTFNLSPNTIRSMVNQITVIDNGERKTANF